MSKTHKNIGKKAIEFRSVEGEKRRLDAMKTPEYKDKMSEISKELLCSEEMRRKISEGTKQGILKRKKRIEEEQIRGVQQRIEFHEIGDTCSSLDLGMASYALMVWSECPVCKIKRWVQRRLSGHLCTTCSRKNPDRHSKASETLKGYREFRFNKGKKRGTKPGYICAPEHREKVRQASLRQWANPETRDRIIKSILEVRSPNKVEIKVLNWLNEQLGNEWKFVGDGQIIIGGCCPDFINTNGKKLIVEFYGAFFHKPQEEGYKKKIYAQFGYDTFAIWSKDIQNSTNRALLFDRLKAWSSGRISREDTQMVFEL